MIFSDITKMAACRIAWETADAYSADIWGPVLWTTCAEMLLHMGLTENQVRAVLRSKITRWARDHFGDQSTWLGEVATLVNQNRPEIESGAYGDGEIGAHVTAPAAQEFDRQIADNGKGE